MSSTHTVSAHLYPRALALTTAIAIISIWGQLDALAGEHGLAPATDLMGALERSGEIGFFEHPTLAWFDASSGFLSALCALGVLACVLLFAGVLPRTSILVAWLAYLSIVNAGFPFTAFQWDTLLLETLVASLFFVPTARIDRFSFAREPHPLARWVVILLLFRLMFRSGLVKLASNDPTWADLSALTLHYETQPLPTLLGWYAHQLPAWAHTASCAVMFAIELGAPFLMLVPHRIPRRIAAGAFVALMLLIAATGNYGFFNLLTVVLCLPLVDDAAWKRILPTRAWALLERASSRTPAREPALLVRRSIAGASGVIAAVGAIAFLGGLAGSDPIERIRPFHTFNDYGLFAVMTTMRREIELEASADGVHWEPYVFRYKPGPPDRAPVWAQPHMPRLDWQMWFAALGSVRGNPWLLRLMQRLTENDPAVLDLLESNPFPDEPPRYVRALLWDYRFTSMEERSRTGKYWRRELIGPYAPIVERQ